MEDPWDDIVGDLRRILAEEGFRLPPGRWFEISSSIHNFVCSGVGESIGEKSTVLYNYLTSLLEDICVRKRNEIRAVSGTPSFLSFVYQKWTSFLEGAEIVDKLFETLNRFYVPRQQEKERVISVKGRYATKVTTLSIHHLCLSVWRKHVLEAEDLVQDIVLAILLDIDKFRDGSSIDVNISLLASLCKSFVLLSSIDDLNCEKGVDLGFYQRNLEKPYIEASQAFYKQKATQLLQTCSIADFMKSVDEKLVEEKELLDQLLHPTSIQTVLRATRDVMIEENSTKIEEEFSKICESSSESRTKSVFDIVWRAMEEIDSLTETQSKAA